MGKHPQSISWEVELPAAVTDEEGDTSLADFTCPVLTDSDVPGLMGLCSLTNKRGLLDTFQDKLYFCGPGSYQITLSPGSRTFKLARAPSGHLVLPISEFTKLAKDKKNETRESLLREPPHDRLHLHSEPLLSDTSAARTSSADSAASRSSSQ